MLLQIVGDGLDHRRREEHPGLRRVDADVVEHGLELGAHERGRQLVHSGHGDRVLRGQRDDRAHAVAPAAAKAFRSAWMPAPPPESDVAIVRRGTAIARRPDPDQVAGRSPYPGRLAVSIRRWPRAFGTTCSRVRSSRTSARSRRARHGWRRSRTRLHPRYERLVGPGRRVSVRPSGRGLGGGGAGRAPDRHDRHGVREDARLQPAGARRARPGAEAAGSLPLPDQGPGAGSGAGAHLVPRPGAAAGDLRRRHRHRPPLADPQVGERDPHQPGHAPRRRPAAPRPLGRRARTSATSSSTRRTSTAGSSARTSATSCGGCGGSPASTAPSRSSSSPRRRSRTRASSPARCSA